VTKEKSDDKSKSVIVKLMIFFITFILAYGTIFSSLYVKKYTLISGDIAKFDIKSPRDTENEYATEVKKNKVLETLTPYYYKDIEIEKHAITTIEALFTRIKQLNSSTAVDEVAVKKILDGMSLTLNTNDIIRLLTMPASDMAQFEKIIKDCITDTYKQNIETDDDIENARDNVAMIFDESNFSKEYRDIALKILNELIQKDYFLDEEKTQEEKEEALKKVQSVMIKKDQLIVKEGEPITDEQIAVLTDLGILSTSQKSNWYLYFTYAALIAIILVVQWTYLTRYKAHIFYRNKSLILVNLLNTGMLLGARVLSGFPFVIPFATIPMLMTLLLDYETALIMGIINIVLVSSIMNFNIELTVIALLQVILTVTMLKQMQQRNDILKVAGKQGVIVALIAFFIGILINNNIIVVVKNTGLVATGSVLSAVLTIGLLPLLENMFNIVTNTKLLELSNPNNALLRRLVLEAPGTYQHSIMVGNLAEMGAEAVGANTILARVGAYYHDIGKLKKPYYFKENQIGFDNPHDRLSPEISASIITAHIEDGIKTAKEYNLPPAIIDIISQHHGKDLVKYFLITMKNASDNPDAINEDDFRYKGIKPSTKESAIVMLADGVEAAVRSLKEADSEKIKDMIDKIIKSRLYEGQLDESPLTLIDLENIKKAFFKCLNSMYHQRIEYPVDKTLNSKEEK